MDRETYEKQKPFAGEKKPSMLRRCVGHDYTVRQMYMITMVTEGRRPLFGRVVGRSDAPEGCDDAPRMELSELGRRVADEWNGIPHYYPQISVLALQMMPDHLHGILFVRERMEKDLSRVIRGFKTGCNRAYRELVMGVSSVATQSQQTGLQTGQQTGLQTGQQTGQQTGLQTGLQQTGQPPGLPPTTRRPKPKDDRSHGLLFARGYNDRLLLRDGQLEQWLNYLNDNPRRLLMKRERPDLFRVQRGLKAGSREFSAIGNRFLLDRPLRVQVQCSRSLTDEQIEARKAHFLTLARQGAVLVSPSISKGEKAVMRAAFEEGHPLIILQENGFTELAKPSGKRMEACARGQLLLMAPWSHHNERLTIRRDQCLTLNALAAEICALDNHHTPLSVTR